MRLLLDASFPRSVTGPQGDGHLFERYEDVPTSDAGVVLYAERELFEAVVFLGRSASAEPSLQSLISQGGKPLVAFTVTDDPDEAALYLRLRVEDVFEAALSKTASAWLIRKQDIQPLGL